MSEWKPPPAGAARMANRVIIPWLSSRLHRPLSDRLMLLRYTGRRSGREYTIPVAYHEWDDGEVLATSTNTAWTWNLRGGQPVHLRVRGRWRRAKPTIVEDHTAVADLLGELAVRKGPRAAAKLRVGLPADREPTREELLLAATRVRLGLFRLVD